MLTAEQLEKRRGKLTGSRVACLMTGDMEGQQRLWQAMIDPENYVEDDLSDVWAVQLGIASEPLHLRWFGRKHGEVTRCGEFVDGPQDWMGATLDGWSTQHQCPIEVKHCGGREPFDTVLERYQPQLHWQMLCANTERAALSVIMGADEPRVEFIDRDIWYASLLMERAEHFMREHVWAFKPPVPLAPVAAPVLPSKVYDMAGSNLWCSAAGDWLKTCDAAKIAREAERELKGLVPEDATLCHGHGVRIARAKNGNLSLRKDKA